jgi:hypothetical protein
MKESDLEKEFSSQIKRYRLPDPIREFKFADEAFDRKWRIDFAWPQFMLGVELHGLTQGGGMHRRGGHETIPGMTNDMNKMNAAILLNWAVLVFTQSHLRCSDAINMTQRALVVRGWEPQHGQ